VAPVVELRVVELRVVELQDLMKLPPKLGVMHGWQNERRLVQVTQVVEPISI